ncbi:MAG TPA: hypothetical protein VMS96_03120, partial [Terriglobales bacterium]|nr:hypothetical protein [Terriglobales bacterium]
MNTHALSEAPVRSRAVGDLPFHRRFYWLVRREILENRSIYLAPLGVAVLIVIGFGFRLVRVAKLDSQDLRGEQPFTFPALLLMGTTMLVAIFYCVDALYGERRDRSILFWKSLPVSDHETVLAKAAIPILVIPLITFVATFVVQVIMLLLAGARGLDLWSGLSFGQMTWILFYHLLLGHGFWYAPFWGWLLLASAWARRAPFLWATLPLLCVGLLEKIAFNSVHFGYWLGNRLAADPMA